MKLFYKKIGHGEPLIILHGLFGSLDNWQTIAKQLGEYFEVYIVDQRNHGHSPHSDHWNYEVMSDDVKELIEDQQLKNSILLGHSMGGKTAIRFASKYSTLLYKLIVVDIGPKYYPVHHHSIIAALQAVDLEKIKTRKEAELVLQEHGIDFSEQQFLLKNLFWTDWENKKLSWRFNLHTISNNIENVGEELLHNSITTPSLFIRGEHSHYITDDDWGLIQQYFPYSELKTIPQAGHWIHADQPAAFIESIKEFCI